MILLDDLTSLHKHIYLRHTSNSANYIQHSEQKNHPQSQSFIITIYISKNNDFLIIHKLNYAKHQNAVNLTKSPRTHYNVRSVTTMCKYVSTSNNHV